jgi:hypothetical protein
MEGAHIAMFIARGQQCQSATRSSNRMLCMVIFLWALALGAVLATPLIVILS